MSKVGNFSFEACTMHSSKLTSDGEVWHYQILNGLPVGITYSSCQTDDIVHLPEAKFDVQL